MSGGYVERSISYHHPGAVGSHQLHFREGQLAAFNEITKLLTERGIELYLVFAPITSELYSSYSNYAEFKNLMNHSGHFVDFNEILTLNDSLHFYDKSHLNQNGVELFNLALIDSLLIN